MIVYYVSGLAMLCGAALSVSMFMMGRRKMEPESEQDAQQRTKEAMETAKT